MRVLSKGGAPALISPHSGLVLLDLLIAAVILGILAMIALPQFSSMATDNKLNGSASEIVSGLQYAANLAVQYQRPFGLRADATANSFSVFDTNPQPNPVPPARPDNTPPVNENGTVLNPFDKLWYARNFDAMEVYQGVRLTAVPTGGVVQFYPDGHSGVSDSAFALSYGGKQKTITVNGTTGQITVQ